MDDAVTALDDGYGGRFVRIGLMCIDNYWLVVKLIHTPDMLRTELLPLQE
jgi:hypothetical protein